jgi:DNA-binding transcriptional MerR regulator
VRFATTLAQFRGRFPQQGTFSLPVAGLIRQIVAEHRVPSLAAVYVIEAMGSAREIVYIGKAGTMCQDGTWKRQMLRKRLCNQQRGKSRQECFQDMLAETGARELRFEWFVTGAPNAERTILPVLAEAELLQAFYDDTGDCPAITSARDAWELPSPADVLIPPSCYNFAMGSAPTPSPLTIGQLARGVGVPTSTVRYYERLGLLKPDARSRSGYRNYSAAAVERLRFIRAAQGAGFSLEDVRQMLELTQSKDSPCETVTALIGHRLEDVRRRLRELERVERTLAAAAKSCCKGGADWCGEVERLQGNKPSAGKPVTATRRVQLTVH